MYVYISIYILCRYIHNSVNRKFDCFIYCFNFYSDFVHQTYQFVPPKSNTLLHLLEKQNALHLLVFSIFFFSTPFSEYWRIRSKTFLQTIRQLLQFSYLCNFSLSILLLNKLLRRGIPKELLDKCSDLLICILVKQILIAHFKV